MKEIFIIYNKTTGFIDGGAGKIDRERDLANVDGSTMLERIPLILAKDINREVVYLPLQTLPDPNKHKIINGEIIDLTEAEKLELKQPELDEELIQKKIRETAISQLKTEGKLSINFK